MYKTFRYTVSFYGWIGSILRGFLCPQLTHIFKALFSCLLVWCISDFALLWVTDLPCLFKYSNWNSWPRKHAYLWGPLEFCVNKRSKYLQNQDRLWEKHSVLIHCDMLLHKCLKERGYPFHYPHAGLRDPQLIWKEENNTPLFICLGHEGAVWQPQLHRSSGAWEQGWLWLLQGQEFASKCLVTSRWPLGDTLSSPW